MASSNAITCRPFPPAVCIHVLSCAENIVFCCFNFCANFGGTLLLTCIAQDVMHSGINSTSTCPAGCHKGTHCRLDCATFASLCNRYAAVATLTTLQAVNGACCLACCLFEAATHIQRCMF